MTDVPRATLRKRFTFDAAHKLPNHSGKCRRLHGHTYAVILSLEGPIRPADGSSGEGMVQDFGDVSAMWKRLHERLDHRYLNDEVPKEWHPTTAENLAGFILAELEDALPLLTSVEVWETPTASAEVRR